MKAESTIAFGEATGGSERPVELDTDVPASALLSESMVKKPFELFFASTGGGHDAVHDLMFARSPSGTPLLSEQPIRQPLAWMSERSTQEPNDQIAKVNSERVALLARKYVAKEGLGHEDSARLAIVTERVRRLLPAVTTKEYEALEQALKVVQQVRASEQDLRERLGLIRRKNG